MIDAVEQPLYSGRVDFLTALRVASAFDGHREQTAMVRA
jgi:hypothetical protein